MAMGMVRMRRELRAIGVHVRPHRLWPGASSAMVGLSAMVNFSYPSVGPTEDCLSEKLDARDTVKNSRARIKGRPKNHSVTR